MQNAASVESFSISAAIDKGFSLVKSDFWLFVGVFVTVHLLPHLPIAAAKIISGDDNGLALLVGTLLQFVLQFGLLLGAIKFCLKKYDNQPTGFNELFSSFAPGLMLNYMVATLLYGLMASLGFVFFVIPGIILSLTFQFYSYAMVENDLGPLQSLKRSSEITQGVKWKLFLLGLALFGINLLGILCLGIGLLFTIPATYMALITVYKQLSTRQPADA
jgi:uncharacterized membrane protein